ncbi:MAG: aminotransferase class V-fold PLP-dependent enzyme [Firmicutes bacterium]|nr:aminotransferase class V-fold PLP-dependent enzyme [Bacillota bacterium]
MKTLNNKKFTFFDKDLSMPNPIPEEGIKKAVELLETGNLYRYTCSTPEESEVSLFEKEFAEFTGARFALGVNSCGSALYISLLSVGVKPGDDVLLSAFTYTAVPSAIINANANPVLIECNENYCIDLTDLKKKITPKTKVLILSHMRGHVSEMDAVVEICQKNGICLIEDCAHSVGATYGGLHTGRFGAIGCFSTQSHKMLNSGEGGVLITDNEELIAKAILYAGSQETFWKKHFIQSQYLEKYQESIPNISMRMSNLTAAVLRAQIPYIKKWVLEYQEKYDALVTIISKSEFIAVPDQNKKVNRGPDTIQFNLKNFNAAEAERFVNILNQGGIGIKSFRSERNPRYYKNWKYINGIEKIHLPQTDNILQFACDMRLPLWLTMKDIETIGNSILQVINIIVEERRSASKVLGF